MDLKPYYTFISNYMSKFRHKVSKDDSDDIFQSACLKCLERGHEVGGSNFFGYLKYSCLAFFREAAKRRRNKPHVKEGSYLPGGVGDLERQEMLDEIEREIGELPPSDRAAIQMEVLGLSAPEAAVLLGTSPMAQWVSRSRGVKTLRTRLNRRGS